MLVQKEAVNNEDGSLGYVECVFKSENILKTVYFVENETLYITFSRGNTYSYLNIPLDFYWEFEEADSHGKFFHSKIKIKYPCHKEYNHYPHEVQELKEIVENNTPEDDE